MREVRMTLSIQVTVPSVAVAVFQSVPRIFKRAAGLTVDVIKHTESAKLPSAITCCIFALFKSTSSTFHPSKINENVNILKLPVQVGLVD